MGLRRPSLPAVGRRVRWVGALVALRYDVITRGGKVFRAGLRMRVLDRTAYGLSLRVVSARTQRWHSVRNVDTRDVDLIEEGEEREDVKVTISKDLVEKLGLKKLAPFGVSEERVRWDSCTLDLSLMKTSRVRELRELVRTQPRAKGASAAIGDMNTWIEAAEKGTGGTKCKQVKHFAALAHAYLKTAERHWLYQKEQARGVWFPYYVGAVTYHPPQTTRSGTIPAYCDLSLHYVELSVMQCDKVTFHQQDVRGLTVPQALAQHGGYVVQTSDLAAAYADHLARYEAVHDKVGKQFWAHGLGTDDLDGNHEEEGHRWRGTTSFLLERDGVRTRVVVDVRRETDKQERGSEDSRPDPAYWSGKLMLEAGEDEKDAIDEEAELEPGDEDPDEGRSPEADVPLHAIVPVFDMRRHLRLRVHVGNLEEYLYDRSLGDKLVLPRDSRRLVDMLLAHRGDFRDVVGGKGGGSIVLCAGTPGTGKTLTAEVYSEVDERPLYTVQCSQLGLEPSDLEAALMKAFARAQRWNAILLLDEADVYVRQRGDDLHQNAIVGVFLRVMEYYSGVLFLTTNRSDLVDDAIASRCVARLDYRAPPPEDLRRIWQILSQVMRVDVSEETVEWAVANLPNASGRDVKNLLKLGKLVSDAEGVPVTRDVVEFVSRFKPTAGGLEK